MKILGWILFVMISIGGGLWYFGRLHTQEKELALAQRETEQAEAALTQARAESAEKLGDMDAEKEKAAGELQTLRDRKAALEAESEELNASIEKAAAAVDQVQAVRADAADAERDLTGGEDPQAALDELKVKIEALKAAIKRVEPR